MLDGHAEEPGRGVVGGAPEEPAPQGHRRSPIDEPFTTSPKKGPTTTNPADEPPEDPQ